MTFRRPALMALGAAAVAQVSPAAATTPAEMWAGVERVVIACDVSDDLPSGLRARLCEQLVAQAGGLAAYPVRLAGPDDVEFGPEGLPRQDRQLLLRIHVAPAGSSAVTVSVRPERLGLRRWQGAAARSAPIALEAGRLTRPVPALTRILAGPADMRRVPAPPRSRL